MRVISFSVRAQRGVATPATNTLNKVEYRALVELQEIRVS